MFSRGVPRVKTLRPFLFRWSCFPRKLLPPSTSRVQAQVPVSLGSSVRRRTDSAFRGRPRTSSPFLVQPPVLTSPGVLLPCIFSLSRCRDYTSSLPPRRERGPNALPAFREFPPVSPSSFRITSPASGPRCLQFGSALRGPGCAPNAANAPVSARRCRGTVGFPQPIPGREQGVSF